MNIYRRIVPAHLRFLIAVHLILLGIFSLFRWVTLAYNRPAYFSSAERSLSVWEAFCIGFWFDVTVASYALLLPYILLTAAFIRPRSNARLFRIIRFYCGLVLLVSLYCRSLM